MSGGETHERTLNKCAHYCTAAGWSFIHISAVKKLFQAPTFHVAFAVNLIYMSDSHYTQVLQGPPMIASEYFAWPISFIYTHIYGPYMFIYEGQLDVYLFQMPITTSSTLQISTMHMLAIPYAHLQSAAHHKAKISKVLNSHI